MKIAGCWAVAWLVVLPACEACDDGPSIEHPGAPDFPGSGGFPGPGFSGGVAGISGGSGMGSAGFPFPGTAGMACTPFGCGMCVECAPGCSDCGFGCTCSDGGAPVALPWDPPFDEVGAVGYRDSTDPWCSGVSEVYGLDVWSDERGVFAIVGGIGPAPIGAAAGDEDAGVPSAPDAGPDPSNGFVDPSAVQPRSELWWNDGQSWKVSVDEVNRLGRHELSGVPGSLVFVNGEPLQRAQIDFGLEPGQAVCALGTLDSSGLDCLDLDPVSSLFVVGAQRAAAVMGGSRLLLYDGERWRGDTTPTPFPVTEVWADDDSVLAAGRAGIVLWREGDAWRLEDPGTLAHITSLWGTAREDVWAGTSDGHVLHYDGVTWNDVAALGGVTCDFAPPITGIWGAGDVVYFHSATQLARIEGGGEIETLANWSCSPNASAGAMAITGLWGNGPDEIFIAILDNARSLNSACGGAHVVYYDGESFHRM